MISDTLENRQDLALTIFLVSPRDSSPISGTNRARTYPHADLGYDPEVALRKEAVIVRTKSVREELPALIPGLLVNGMH